MKKQGFLTTVLFCLFLGAMLLLTLLLPHRAFSELENRSLQPMPTLSADAVLSGQWMEDAESWVSDHTVLRDQWVQLRAIYERLGGKQECGGVYYAAQDTLLSRVDAPDAAQAEKNLEAVRVFAAACPVPVRLGLIPSAASVWADRLPAGAETLDEAAWITRLEAGFDGETVPISAALLAHRAEDVYYRTDHHWTSLGARYAADAVLAVLGQPLLREEELSPEVVSTDFCGTASWRSGAWWVRPDSITRMVADPGVRVRSGVDGEREGSLYDASWLEKKNQYAYFLGGNQPLCVLEAPTEGPKLLLVRDSYSDSLAPFLCLRFSEVHLVDLRYYRGSVQDYVREHEIDEVLVLYSLSTFLEDRSLPLLRR